MLLETAALFLFGSEFREACGAAISDLIALKIQISFILVMSTLLLQNAREQFIIAQVDIDAQLALVLIESIMHKLFKSIYMIRLK